MNRQHMDEQPSVNSVGPVRRPLPSGAPSGFHQGQSDPRFPPVANNHYGPYDRQQHHGNTFPRLTARSNRGRNHGIFPRRTSAAYEVGTGQRPGAAASSYQITSNFDSSSTSANSQHNNRTALAESSLVSSSERGLTEPLNRARPMFAQHWPRGDPHLMRLAPRASSSSSSHTQAISPTPTQNSRDPAPRATSVHMQDARFVPDERDPRWTVWRHDNSPAQPPAITGPKYLGLTHTPDASLEKRRKLEQPCLISRSKEGVLYIDLTEDDPPQSSVSTPSAVTTNPSSERSAATSQPKVSAPQERNKVPNRGVQTSDSDPVAASHSHQAQTASQQMINRTEDNANAMQSPKPNHDQVRASVKATAVVLDTNTSGKVSRVPRINSAIIPASSAKTSRGKSKGGGFDSDAFDTLIYQQEAARAPPDGVGTNSRPDQTRSVVGYGKMFLRTNPAIHRMHKCSEEWYENKMEEIKARGGRKKWFGKAAERMRWLQKTEEDSARSQSHKTPKPWAYDRGLDFGDVPESQLPRDVLQNQAWLEACAWHRGGLTLNAMRALAVNRSVQQTEEMYLAILRNARQTDIEEDEQDTQ